MRRFETLFKLLAVSLLAVSTIGHVHAAERNVFQDPLNTPAMEITGAQKLWNQPIISVATRKGKIVGAGLRGVIILSDDNGTTWRQAKVPVQSDLTAITFITDRTGFAVGHDGVILSTNDAGETWVKQLDGNMAAADFPKYYEKRIAGGDAGLQPALAQLNLNVKGGAVLPYLSVYFENERLGYAVGSFGSIVRTEDGGKSWIPWLDHVDNDQSLNLNDIRKIDSDVYIAGERGMIWKLDKEAQRFKAISTGYRGSFFSLAGRGNALLTFGIGGTVFRSADAGVTWHQVKMNTSAALTAGVITEDGGALLVSENGQLLIGDDSWQNFKRGHVERPTKYASIALTGNGDGKVVLAGYGGISVQALPQKTSSAKQ